MMMLILYFKQAWNLIRQERLFSLIYIVGTGLSVTMVMVLSIVFYMKVANLYPETNRDRTLFAQGGRVELADGSMSLSALSEPVIRTCFGSLKGVEALSISTRSRRMGKVQPEGSPDQIPVMYRYVDNGFWKVFNFQYLSGKPFTAADMQSGIQTAVVAGSLARRLFGTTDAVGRYVSLDFRPYRICGVVKDASVIADQAYAQLWLPYTANPDYTPASVHDQTGSLGIFNAYILAAPGTDLAVLKAEAEENIRRYSQTLGEKNSFTMQGQPDYQWQTVLRTQGAINWNGFWSSILLYGIMLFILLLVPAVSLSGMTDSRMERRLAEMGIRRAFGAPRATLMGQIVSENLLFTLLGGGCGLLCSYLVIWLMSDWVMQLVGNSNYSVAEGAGMGLSPAMMINYQVFGIALLVCFLLNLLSALIPAWRAARRQIICSLNAK